MDQGQQGELNWRLSAHPITLLVFLGIRIGPCHTLRLNTKGTPDSHTYISGALLMYLFGVLFIDNLYVPSCQAI